MKLLQNVIPGPLSTPRSTVVCPAGRLDYEHAWNLQKRIQTALIDAKRNAEPAPPPNVLLLVEHPPVYTLGKSGNAENLLLSHSELENQDIRYFVVDRGGDITFHGPGQLVVYPILDLDRFFTDIGKYLRLLEEAVIRTCAEYGLETQRIKGKTGVWIVEKGKTPRKICAMGIRCSRWVTMHGLAFNLNTGLDYFENIVPCGIADGDVTSLSQEWGQPIDETEAATIFLTHFSDLFDAPISVLSPDDVEPFLGAYLSTGAEK